MDFLKNFVANICLLPPPVAGRNSQWFRSLRFFTLLILVLTGDGVLAADLLVPTEVVAHAGGTVTLEISYRSQGASVAGFQLDLGYDRAALTITPTAGPAAASAGKTLSSAVLPNGRLRLLVSGFNQNVISDGDVITLSVQVAANAPSGPYTLGAFNALASTPAGELITLSVNGIATNTTLKSSLNPSTFGAAVTFTATVTSTGGTPTGTVTFKDGTTTLGSGTLSSGKATFKTSTLALGTRSITAVYSGSTDFLTSTSSVLPETVKQATSSTALASSPNPSTFGAAVTFTATVTSTGGTPTGTVTFKDGTTTLGSGTLSSGKATFKTSTLALGTRSITAVYAGSTDFLTSTSSVLPETVKQATSSTALASSLNPSTFGAAVTFTATVTSTGGTPTGTVTFKDGSTTLDTTPLSAGKAAFLTSTLVVGVHSITAEYNGGADYNMSTSSALSQTVNKEGTSCPASVNLTLCGTYAMGLRGFNSSGGPVAAGSVFVADDSGHIISGMTEVNQSGTGPANRTITGGSYLMDPSGDGRGVLTLIDSTATSRTYRFVLESVNNPGIAPIEQFDKSGTIASGILAGPETLPISQLLANSIFALTLEGINGSDQRAAMLGEFQIGSRGCDGSAGSFNSLAGEPVVTNTAGTVHVSLTATGSCTTLDPNTGVGTAQITISGGAPFTDATLHFVYLAVEAGGQVQGALFLETDAIAANQPILSGLAGVVGAPMGGFNASSLGCPCLFVRSGTTDGTTKTGHSLASIVRLLTTPGPGASGTLTGIEDRNAGGIITLAGALGPYNYKVDAKGVGSISAPSTIHFVIVGDTMETMDESVSVLTGSFRPQNATSIQAPGKPYIVGLGNADLVGLNRNVENFVGVITPSGATSGTLTGTVDNISSGGSVVGVAVSGTYAAIDSDGRGTGTLNLAGGTSNVSIVIYARRARQFVILDIQSSNPYLLGARLQ
jgi:hypothetical protein